MSKNDIHHKSGKSPSQLRGGTRAATTRITATHAQYVTARRHDEIVKLPINDPVRRTAEAYLTELKKRNGDTTAARTATIRVLGAPAALRHVGPVSPLQLGDGIALAKKVLHPA